MTARQLLEQRGNVVWLSPAALEAWLLRNGFAQVNSQSGRLVPTELGHQVGGSLGFLG